MGHLAVPDGPGRPGDPRVLGGHRSAAEDPARGVRAARRGRGLADPGGSCRPGLRRDDQPPHGPRPLGSPPPGRAGPPDRRHPAQRPGPAGRGAAPHPGARPAPPPGGRAAGHLRGTGTGARRDRAAAPPPGTWIPGRTGSAARRRVPERAGDLGAWRCCARRACPPSCSSGGWSSAAGCGTSTPPTTTSCSPWRWTAPPTTAPGNSGRRTSIAMRSSPPSGGRRCASATARSRVTPNGARGRSAPSMTPGCGSSGAGRGRSVGIPGPATPSRRTRQSRGQRKTSTMIATESSAMYEIEMWNSCIGRVSASRLIRPSRRCASTANHRPSPAADAV